MARDVEEIAREVVDLSVQIEAKTRILIPLRELNDRVVLLVGHYGNVVEAELNYRHARRMAEACRQVQMSVITGILGVGLSFAAVVVLRAATLARATNVLATARAAQVAAQASRISAVSGGVQASVTGARTIWSAVFGIRWGGVLGENLFAAWMGTHGGATLVNAIYSLLLPACFSWVGKVGFAALFLGTRDAEKAQSWIGVWIELMTEDERTGHEILARLDELRRRYPATLHGPDRRGRHAPDVAHIAGLNPEALKRLSLAFRMNEEVTRLRGKFTHLLGMSGPEFFALEERAKKEVAGALFKNMAANGGPTRPEEMSQDQALELHGAIALVLRNAWSEVLSDLNPEYMRRLIEVTELERACLPKVLELTQALTPPSIKQSR